ncbi:adenylate/guanylate cyclase domain-containing protein [Methylobacterium aquaticum]|uniref:Adenylate cyclase, family 3 n=1 Tax=Methylobacterium aquaticum TaxID=270351 RepID=A0A0C6F9W5_9HYPH|nr:adenylate/guanylate cyclase domain-containing protein [Methylobacterium aquaticum]BAQ49586.1 adenylate cyclase, family 3 [Methylobacterium aquaticum]
MSAPAAQHLDVTPRPSAIIVFVDIRGFSQWSREIESHESTLSLIQQFQYIIKKNFKWPYLKPLGDGAMLVKEITNHSESSIKSEIDQICKMAIKCEKEFHRLTQKLAREYGNPTSMDLGWGVTRGKVIKQVVGDTTDYLGHNINKASRLCDLARPKGLVIDRDDFIDEPAKYRTQLYQQVKILNKPYLHVPVWVSKEIYEEFQTREHQKETPEVHVAGVCIKETLSSLEILVAQRNAKRKLFPRKWEGCGGQLRYSEMFDAGVIRHYRSEMQIAVSVVSDVPPVVYSINTAQEPVIPGLRFLCKYVGGTAKSANHDEIKWVPLAEFESMSEEDFPPGLKSEAIQLIARYKERQPSS